MDTLLTVLFAVGGLSILIIAHESGHYLVARAFGMRVLRYSIGIGPALFRYKPPDSPTTFQVCAIPFLAYVQIDGMHPQEENDPNDPDIFQNKSLFGRFATVAAGPFANYLTAVVLTFGLALFGWPGPERTPMEVGKVTAGSPAEQGGVEPGDIVFEAHGTPIENTAGLIQVTRKRAGMATEYRVRRGDQELALSIVPTTRIEVGIGLSIDTIDGPEARITEVWEDTPAEKLGFEEGDLIVKAGTQDTASALALATHLRQHGIPRSFVVDRAGAEHALEFGENVPARYFENDEYVVRGIIGVTGGDGPMALGDAAMLAWVFPFDLTAKSISGVITAASNLDSRAVAGPVRMGSYIAKSAEHGVHQYIYMLVMLSVALGFTNLLPFPALDGGRLVFLAYEAVTQQPANARVEGWVHLVGIVFLLAVVALVTFRELLEEVLS